MSFSTLLKYYVDYSRPNIKQTVARLVANLDKLTFLSDMLESLVTDIKADMREVFDGKQEFSQFDAVSQVLTQLRGFLLKCCFHRRRFIRATVAAYWITYVIATVVIDIGESKNIFELLIILLLVMFSALVFR